MYQDGDTLLTVVAYNGHLPVIEYLVERGADMEAKDRVSHVIIFMFSHTYMSLDENIRGPPCSSGRGRYSQCGAVYR